MESVYHIEKPEYSCECYYWLGKDYSNCYKEDFKELEHFAKGLYCSDQAYKVLKNIKSVFFFKDQFDRTTTHRMPWRDEGLVVFGESARDLARHFIQRWNQCKVKL